MSTWKELYDDFLQELALYQEEIKMTPQQGMRMLTKAMSEFQRLTFIAEDTRTLTVTGNPALPTATYALGNDVLEIIDISDPAGFSLMSTGYQQFRSIIDRSASGVIGYNETPHHASLVRERPGSTLPEFELASGLGMMRIYTVWANQLMRYPAEAADTTLTMRFRPHYDQFSVASTQWTAWFASDDAFEANFATLTPPAQLSRWFPAFVSHAVSQYIRSQNTLSGQQPLWMQYDNEFRQYVVEAIESKQQHVSGLSGPYNISPYSS